MKESVLYASIRSLFVAMSTMAGLALGLIPFFLIIGSFATTSEGSIDSVYSVEIQPNADGVRKSLSKSAPVILKIDIVGAIGVDGLNMQSIRQLLVESREDTLKGDRVKAILLHIESPGGTVVDADGIYRAIKAYKEHYKVPVYAYIDGMCASGAMYIAAAADKVIASDVSLIGSVGVVILTPFFNVTQLLEKAGVKTLTLSAGKDKDPLNPFRQWEPGEQENLQSVIDYYYHHFINVVVSNRPALTKDKLIKDYGAKVFPAELAKEYGYIDEYNISYQDTLKQLLKHIGIEDDFYQVVRLEKKTWYSSLISSKSTLFTGKVKHEFSLGIEHNPELSGKILYLYRPEAP